MINYIPVDFLFLIPMYGNIGPFGIGQIFNLGFLFLLFYLIFHFDNQSKNYSNGLIKKFCVYLLDGKTGSGKTRLLTQIACDTKIKSKNTIIISNFLSDYSDLFFASIQDFKLLQIDIARLGEHINFDIEEKKQINKIFPGYFSFLEKDLEKKIKKIKGKYEILTLADEFYAYFHNRNFMGNFSSKNGGDELLLNLHQTRHSNQTLILASQDDDNLDLDFRQIAHKEINVFSLFSDLIFGFNLYAYLSSKKIKKQGINFNKTNFLPYIFFNFYELKNKINMVRFIMINFYNYIFTTSLFLDNFYFYKFKKILYYEKEYFSNKILKYNTKFNVKKSLNIYKPGDIYDYIINIEKKIN